MAKKITVRKLAAELNLAPSTVHRALSGHPNVQQETRRMVLQAAHRSGYLLPQHGKRSIAVIVPFFGFEGYLGSLLSCIETEFHKRGFRLHLIPEADISLLEDHMFDGIVSLVWQEGLEKMLPQNYAIPILTLNSAANQLENVPCIGSDPKGIRMALDYLHAKGCRNIFFITTSIQNTPNAAERLEEFRKFCSETGQNYDSMHIELSSVSEKCIHVILEAKTDACFCASETFAFKIGHLLQNAGIRIPEDISLMGLEDAYYNTYFSPPITAIRQNFEQMAEIAAAEMFAACENKTIPHGRLIPFTLIERESVRKV